MRFSLFVLVGALLVSATVSAQPGVTPPPPRDAAQIAGDLARFIRTTSPRNLRPPPTRAQRQAILVMQRELAGFDSARCEISIGRLNSKLHEVLKATATGATGGPITTDFRRWLSYLTNQIAELERHCNPPPGIWSGSLSAFPAGSVNRACEDQCKDEYSDYVYAQGALNIALGAIVSNEWARIDGRTSTRTTTEADVVKLRRDLEKAYAAYLACLSRCGDAVDRDSLYGGLIPSSPLSVRTHTPPAREPSTTPVTPRVGGALGQPRKVGSAPRLVAPGGAFAGGTIGGTVYTDEGEPHRAQSVALTTLSGVVVSQTETDDDGAYALDTPTSGDSLIVTVPNALGQLIGIAVPLLRAMPDWVHGRTPDYVHVGESLSVEGQYTEADIEPMDEVDAPEATPLASAWSRSADGSQALTTVVLPTDLATGEVTLVLREASGAEQRSRLGLFRIVSAEIDQDRLRSGDDAEFSYEFDFGPGPERVAEVTVSVSGPISYDRAGEPQQLRIDEEGRAELRGDVRGEQGSPSGAPFAIRPTLRRVDR